MYAIMSVKGTFKSEEILEISIFVPSTTDQTFHCTRLYSLNFRAQKSTLKVVSVRKNISRFEWLNNQRAKDCFELIFWNLEWLLTLFTLFLLYNNVGEFKFEIEEQKKVHMVVDMINISPPSENNVPLRHGVFCLMGRKKQGPSREKPHDVTDINVRFYWVGQVLIHQRINLIFWKSVLETGRKKCTGYKSWDHQSQALYE